MSTDSVRVFFLPNQHELFYPTGQQLQKAKMHKIFVEKHYKVGDSIWVEESAEKPTGCLHKNQIKNLTLSDAKIQGWDNPTVCEQAEELSASLVKASRQESTQKKIEFVVATFDMRQDYLFHRITRFVTDETGRAYIFLGPLHISAQFLEKLTQAKIPFAIV